MLIGRLPQLKETMDKIWSCNFVKNKKYLILFKKINFFKRNYLTHWSFLMWWSLLQVINETNFILIWKAIYTIYTIHEIDPILFICPSKYPYASQKVKTACIIRAANFICMWIYSALMLICTMIISIMFYNDRKVNIRTIQNISNPSLIHD